MSDRQYPGPLHPQRTQRSGYQYFFYDKHHKAGRAEDAQWLPDLLADSYDLSNANGHLYGLRIDAKGTNLDLGTRREQVAQFHVTQPGHAWHGHPAWPIMRLDRDKTERKNPAPRDALAKMRAAGLLTENQRKRLAGGKHI